MINYDEVAPDILLRIGTSYANDANAPDAIVKAFNKAVEFIAETVLKDGFIFEYSFTGDGTNTEYNTPLIFSVREMFRGDTRLVENLDWVFWKDKILNPEKIAIASEKIYFPTAPTEEFTVQYRGAPTKVDLNTTSTKAVNLPSNFAKPIVPLAAYFVFRNAKQYDYASAEMQDYEMMISGTKSSMADRNEKRPERLGGNHRF